MSMVPIKRTGGSYHRSASIYIRCKCSINKSVTRGFVMREHGWYKHIMGLNQKWPMNLIQYPSIVNFLINLIPVSDVLFSRINYYVTSVSEKHGIEMQGCMKHHKSNHAVEHIYLKLVHQTPHTHTHFGIIYRWVIHTYCAVGQILQCHILYPFWFGLKIVQMCVCVCGNEKSRERESSINSVYVSIRV